MDLKLLLPKEHVLCSIDANTRREFLSKMAEMLVQEGTVTDKERFLDAVENREDAMTTQTDGGYLTPLGRDAAERAQDLLSILTTAPALAKPVL